MSPQDLSETETTFVVPVCIEDTTESPPLTPPTPEALLFPQQAPRALTPPLNGVTFGVVAPTWSETLPAVGCLPLSRLERIPYFSANAKKQLAGGLEELQQVKSSSSQANV